MIEQHINLFVTCLSLLNFRVTEILFRRRNFSHQTKHFCCGSAFFLHDNSVLQTFATRFQSAIFWNRNLLAGCANLQAAKPESGDYTDANTGASQCILQQPLPNWLNTPQRTQRVKLQLNFFHLWQLWAGSKQLKQLRWYVITKLPRWQLTWHAYYSALGCSWKRGQQLH